MILLLKFIPVYSSKISDCHGERALWDNFPKNDEHGEVITTQSIIQGITRQDPIVFFTLVYNTKFNFSKNTNNSVTRLSKVNKIFRLYWL